MGLFRGPSSRLASNNSSVHHTIFDHHESEKFSENVRPFQYEAHLEKIFLEKANSLMPSDEEQEALNSLHEKVKSSILNYISQKTLFGGVVVVACYDIGSLKISAMLHGHKTSDLMCIFSGPISHTHLVLLNQKLQEDFKSNLSSQNFIVTKNDNVPRIEICCSEFKVKLWPVSEKISGHDPAVHISKDLLNFNKVAINHVSWFSDNISNENVVRLILLLKDLRNRFEGLKPLTPWLICLLAHYCTTRTNDRSTISLHSAFRRCIKYLASGFFLANSVGIVDPCESGNTRAHLIMTLVEQDLVCCTAQYLTNVGSILGYENILELRSDSIEGPHNCTIKLSESIQL